MSGSTSMQMPSPLDEAELKLEFRRLYAKIGTIGCLQVMYEFLISAKWLGEVIMEEGKR